MDTRSVDTMDGTVTAPHSSNELSPRRGAVPDGGGGLVARARLAARRADQVGAAGGSAAWRAMATRAARELACVLGVDPADVTAAPDPVRRYGMFGPAVLLHHYPTPASPDPGTDPADPSQTGPVGSGAVPVGSGAVPVGSGGAGGEGFWFVPREGDRYGFWLLARCRVCDRHVRSFRIDSLVDLGRHLDPDTGQITGRPDDCEFTTDPAHGTGCTLHIPPRPGGDMW